MIFCNTNNKEHIFILNTAIQKDHVTLSLSCDRLSSHSAFLEIEDGDKDTSDKKSVSDKGRKMIKQMKPYSAQILRYNLTSVL